MPDCPEWEALDHMKHTFKYSYKSHVHDKPSTETEWYLGSWLVKVT